MAKDIGQMLRSKWLPAAITVSIAAIALGFFLKAGGFGGGHGRFDQVIGILGLPWIALLMLLPQSPLTDSDLVNLIAIPFIVNTAVLYAIRALLLSRKSSSRE